MPTQNWENLIQQAEKLKQRLSKGTKLSLNPPEVSLGVTPHEVVFTENKLRLLHYLPQTETQSKYPLILIFALVNRPYVLDLMPGKSVVEVLLKSGIDVYLIDWGVPGDEDKHQDINHYVNRYIRKVVKKVKSRAGVDKVSLLGYCMGGTFATIYTALHPEDIKNLILLSAGIDFNVPGGVLNLWGSKENFNVDKFVDAHGNVPPEFLQTGFMLMKPVQNMVSKYLNFYENIENERFVENFVAMETWLNDNIPLAGEVFREFIKNLYQDNQLVKNTLKINGKRVDMKKITCPVLSLVAENDHLVPPESSTVVDKLVGSTDTKTVVYPTGHIGLSVSSRSLKNLWPEAAGWIKERSED